MLKRFQLIEELKRVNKSHLHVLDQTAFGSKTRLEGSKTNCRVSVTSRKSVARPEPIFRVDQARPLAQMEEPSHCRRLATATQGIRSSAEINVTGG